MPLNLAFCVKTAQVYWKLAVKAKQKSDLLLTSCKHKTIKMLWGINQGKLNYSKGKVNVCKKCSLNCL